jgi:hypothetical protein
MGERRNVDVKSEERRAISADNDLGDEAIEKIGSGVRKAPRSIAALVCRSRSFERDSLTASLSTRPRAISSRTSLIASHTAPG